MTELTIFKHNGGAYIDSREVAELIGKQHGHLMRDIRGYVKTMEKITQSNCFCQAKNGPVDIVEKWSIWEDK